MLSGLMMDQSLTITAILRHALRFHPRARIVSRQGDGSIHEYTYADFGRRVHQLANALVRLGVKPGDRVGTLAWNGYRHLEIYYAVSCIGAVCHTMNPRLFHEQLAYIANDAEDTHLFFDLSFAGLVETLSHEFTTVQGYVALCSAEEMPESGIDGLMCYEDLIGGEADSFDWPDLDERSASALCYTSGTTGNPKGVLYNHRSTILHGLAVSGGDWLSIRARDAVLPVVPMFHANAWGIPYAALMNGARLVLPGHAMDGASLTELLEREGVTLMAGVPTVWLELLRHLRETGKRLDKVERMMVGGAAAPLAMVRAFEEEHDIRVVHGWGMTELSPVGTLGALKGDEITLPAEDRYRIQCYQGRPLFGVDIRLMADDGTILPHDGEAVGVLQVRGPWVAGGYFKGAAPEQFTEDGWFSTGDLAAIDAEGYLHITDRTKDVIKSGGEWISSIDLENIAVGHPDVAEVACIAIAHSKWGERPMLCVVAREGADFDPATLMAMYDGHVASWWKPDHIELVDSLPYTATGKLSKLTLRQKFAGLTLPTDN